MRWPTLSNSTIGEHNLSIEKQLVKKGLLSYDVIGDGNCFFRSVSVTLNGNEDSFASLRKSIITYMAADVSLSISDVSPDDNLPINKHINNIKNNGIWVGEDVVLATSKFLHRELHVYIAAEASSPLICAPSTLDQSLPPISLAFYEPGHYCAVLSKANVPTCSKCSSYLGNEMGEPVTT